MRFILSRRWFLFAVAVALMAWGAWLLGQWQFHRLDDRRHDNTVLAHNLKDPAVPVAEVMSKDEATTHEDEWKRITMTGRYDDSQTVVLKYQTRDGNAGVDVVTPLVGKDGTALLVDRGWLATDSAGNTRPTTPPATTGEVTVTAFVRANATGSATNVSDLETRALSSDTLKSHIDHDLYVGFADLEKQTPAASDDLVTVELPDTHSEGPHFFYGLQWWFFGLLAVFGFFYLMYDEWKKSKNAPAGLASKAPDHAAVDGHDRTGDERRGRPEQERGNPAEL